MAVTPQTEIKLLMCPLALDNKNQLTFSDKTAQFNYFNSLPSLTVDNFSYQRKEGKIRFPAHIDSLLNYNYVMYQNENYTDKWFYAFITRMEYLNDGVTEIYITTDVFQTWQFDIDFRRSFVEREHISVAEDIPGANLVPEGLETGEFTIGGTAEINGLNPIYVLAYSRDPQEDGLTDETSTGFGINLNGIPTGMFYWVGSSKGLFAIIDTITKKGFADSIVSIFSVPQICFLGFNGWTLENLAEDLISYWIVQDFKSEGRETTLVSTPTLLDGYTPRNQKLRTYPYCYLAYNPINGNEKIYRYEDFQNGTPIFKMISEINPNPTICLIPQNYRGQSGNSLSDISILNGFPQIAWISDYFSGWLAQNSNIVSLQMSQEQFNYEVETVKTGISGVSSMISNAMRGNVASAGLDVVNTGLNIATNEVNHDYYIKNQMAQVEKQKMLPNTAHLGTSATLLGYELINDNIFTRYTIKYQFAEKIDDYFDMYGYLTNRLKIPNLNNRPNWNYIKTIGANIRGNIPQMDLQIIKEMFNNGITLWHNTENFLNYSAINR